nr:MAG TPA: hypothetical protein [Caudoviricetes sp.]
MEENQELEQASSYLEEMADEQEVPAAEEPFRVFASEQEWNEELEQRVQSRMQEQRSQEEQKMTEEITKGWQQQAAELKAKVPAFDFRNALQENKAFAEKIARGYSVEDAYTLTLPQGRSVPRRGIKENGAAPAPGGSIQYDPLHMKQKEFEQYIEGLMGKGI